jgi:IS1 family transposase
MSKLTKEKQASVVQCLVEGVGVNATARLTGASKPTILSLLKKAGNACAILHDSRVRDLKPARVECDEVWSFVFAKERNIRPEKRGTVHMGDSWLWVAIDPETKLIISYFVGLRTPDDARCFMLDLAGRVTNITQLTTDGYNAYPEAVRAAFGTSVDFAQLIKTYGEVPQTEARYSPPKFNGSKKHAVIGMPHPAYVSTSIVERQNLNFRMGIRRMTRLTNAFSKKHENHVLSIGLYIAYYNFCRVHKSLRMTPAMAAGLTDRAWEIGDLVDYFNCNNAL